MIDISNCIWDITEMGKAFDANKKILLEICSDDEDGTFPNVNSYINLIQKIDKYGPQEYLNKFFRKAKKCDFGDYKIIRENINSDKVKIVFKEKIECVFGFINERPITDFVKEIHGTLQWDCFFHKGERRQNRVAHSFEIYLRTEKFF